MTAVVLRGRNAIDSSTGVKSVDWSCAVAVKGDVSISSETVLRLVRLLTLTEFNSIVYFYLNVC